MLSDRGNTRKPGIESLILQKGINDALKRAAAYVTAGADGIMIHSKEKDGKEIISFCKEYEKLESKANLIKYKQDEDHYEIILDKTPFYAESGGQIGDMGKLTADGFSFNVEDVQKYWQCRKFSPKFFLVLRVP